MDCSNNFFSWFDSYHNLNFFFYVFWSRPQFVCCDWKSDTANPTTFTGHNTRVMRGDRPNGSVETEIKINIKPTKNLGHHYANKMFIFAMHTLQGSRMRRDRGCESAPQTRSNGNKLIGNNSRVQDVQAVKGMTVVVVDPKPTWFWGCVKAKARVSDNYPHDTSCIRVFMCVCVSMYICVWVTCVWEGASVRVRMCIQVSICTRVVYE